ncbi:MAG: sialidase family protein [Lentisphaerota bacterium]
MKKICDIVIYEDNKYFCAFPSIVRQSNGELILAFRRAPERRPYGGRCTHGDPNAQLVLVRSKDGGQTWTQKPELVYAHPFGGSQDPCMTLLQDGTILCSSYLWVFQQPQCPAGGVYDNTGWKMTFAGGYLLRSSDSGHQWKEIIPPPVPGCVAVDAFGNLLPAYNRGNILAAVDGLLYWAVVRADCAIQPGTGGSRTSVHLMVSSDKGDTWQYRCPIAVDKKIGFNETYLYETANGDIVAFLRTADEEGKVQNAIARSSDRGMSFEKWQGFGFHGHPHCTARLNDGRVLLVYGYRLKPYGIRGKVLNSECTDICEAKEFIIRDDGGSTDLGYPWPMVFPDGRVLIVYYFNTNKSLPSTWPKPTTADNGGERHAGTTAFGGIRHIAGTWLEI